MHAPLGHRDASRTTGPRSCRTPESPGADRGSPWRRSGARGRRCRGDRNQTGVGRVAAAARELDWPATPDPWPAVLVRTGCPADRVRDIVWSGATLRDLLRAVAGASGRDPDGFIAAVGGRLHADADSAERRLAELRVEETRLASRLTADRDRTPRGRCTADDAMDSEHCLCRGFFGPRVGTCTRDARPTPGSARRRGRPVGRIGFVLSDGGVTAAAERFVVAAFVALRRRYWGHFRFEQEGSSDPVEIGFVLPCRYSSSDRTEVGTRPRTSLPT